MFGSRSMLSTLGIALAMSMSTWGSLAAACPFCSSVSQTFTEEFTASDIVVIADLLEVPELPDEDADPDAPLPRAKFAVKSIIKGSDHVKVGHEIEVLFFGEGKKDRVYLLTGTEPSNVMWSTPLELSERAHAYVTQVLELPEDASRLEFFQDYLEDEDEMLARDAYDEFAKTPYDGVIALKPKMKHDKLVEFIKDPQVPASRRRLYFTMLGVCGTEDDAPLLREFITSSDRKAKAGMDAMIACYLLLTGEEGLNEIEELFLKNKEADYPDTYAAIMAIRFHGNETDKIEKQRLIEALRHLLDRPDLADLVIRDLARWKDWEVMPKLVALFKEADEKSSWVRVPVINYLRSCPLPAAKEQIEELKKIDADAVKRAETFYPNTPYTDESDEPAPEDTSLQEMAPLPMQPLQPQPIQTVQQPKPIEPNTFVATQVQSTPALDPEDTVALANVTRPAESETEAPALMPVSGKRLSSGGNKPSLATVADWQPNRMMLWGVPIIGGVVMLFVLRLVLGVPYRVVA